MQMKQTLPNGVIQYRKAFIDMDTGWLYAYGVDEVTGPSRVMEDIAYFDCVEKRPDQDGYFESHWGWTPWGNSSSTD